MIYFHFGDRGSGKSTKALTKAKELGVERVSEYGSRLRELNTIPRKEAIKSRHTRPKNVVIDELFQGPSAWFLQDYILSAESYTDFHIYTSPPSPYHDVHEGLLKKFPELLL